MVAIDETIFQAFTCLDEGLLGASMTRIAVLLHITEREVEEQFCITN